MDWEIFLGCRARHEAMLREAEERRRVRQIRSSCAASPRLSDQMLAQLGRWFVAWGLALQARYDANFVRLTTSNSEPKG